MSEKAEKKQTQMPGMDSSTLKTGSIPPDTGSGTAGTGSLPQDACGGAATDKTDTDARVYIGPDIPGAKQYTVFNNGLPESLKKKTGRKPFFNSLIIPVKKLAQAGRELDTEGSALNILFKKAVKEIQEG
ncbi:MAG: hypothetical protein K1W15_03750 [Lachnospiraceae bacterium]